ncbi:MAG: hypothetical protein WC477_03925 [Patescibacteria group bacterium]
MGCNVQNSEDHQQIVDLSKKIVDLQNSVANQEPKKALAPDDGFVHNWKCSDPSNPYTNYAGCKPADFQTVTIDSGYFQLMYYVGLNGRMRVYNFSRRIMKGNGSLYMEINVTLESNIKIFDSLAITDKMELPSAHELKKQIASLLGLNGA